jgi:uracil-DNA glycosylase
MHPNKEDAMIYCDTCKHLGMQFDASFPPQQYVYGFPESPIWIVGLNPKARTGETKHEHTLDELREEFRIRAPKDSYFLDFRRVSPLVFGLLGNPSGVAHTDVVKCLADTFPKKEATENCSPFLLEQITKHHPKLLICNGRAVCDAIRWLISPPETFREESDTSYTASVEGVEVIIVLSGFLARIDNYAKRRLGIEIENYMRRLGIEVPST